MPARPASLRGRRVLVTAGPTREYFDPVRFLSNPSTGRMGYALAAAAQKRGAQVILISGPTELAPPRGVKLIAVTSAAEMYRAALKIFRESELIFKVAAVGDYRPKKVQCKKIKKTGKALKIELVPTPDILTALGRCKKSHQFLVGFAAETDRLLANARKKLRRKNLDLIVVNDVRRKDSGFAATNNQVTVLFKDGRTQGLPRISKQRLAERLLTLTLREWQGPPRRAR